MNLAQSILFSFSLENIYQNNTILFVLALIVAIVSLIVLIKFLLLIDDRYELNKFGRISLLNFTILLFLSIDIGNKTFEKSDALFSVDKGQVLYSVKFEDAHFDCSMNDIFSCFHLERKVSRLEVYDRKTSKLKIIHECSPISLSKCISLIDSKIEKIMSQEEVHLTLKNL